METNSRAWEKRQDAEEDSDETVAREMTLNIEDSCAYKSTTDYSTAFTPRKRRQQRRLIVFATICFTVTLLFSVLSVLNIEDQEEIYQLMNAFSLIRSRVDYPLPLNDTL